MSRDGRRSSPPRKASRRPSTRRSTAPTPVDADLGAFLEQVHRRYANRRYLDSDPVRAVHRYSDPRDQEAVAFLAAGLAFGNVRVILASVDRALAPLGARPARALAGMDAAAAARAAQGFNHRWIFAPDLANLYRLLGAALREAGGLEPLFSAGLRDVAADSDSGSGSGPGPDSGSDSGSGSGSGSGPGPGSGSGPGPGADGQALPASRVPADIRPGAAALVSGLRALAPPEVDLERRGTRYFLADVQGTGAAKRLCMFLRWMIRRDAVDLGLWRAAHPAQLIIPLDVHIARLGRRLGLTGRRTAGMAMAREITAVLRRLAPEDPVKYDFALARLGILRICPMRRDGLRCADCDLFDACRL